MFHKDGGFRGPPCDGILFIEDFKQLFQQGIFFVKLTVLEEVGIEYLIHSDKVIVFEIILEIIPIHRRVNEDIRLNSSSGIEEIAEETLQSFESFNVLESIRMGQICVFYNSGCYPAHLKVFLVSGCPFLYFLEVFDHHPLEVVQSGADIGTGDGKFCTDFGGFIILKHPLGGNSRAGSFRHPHIIDLVTFLQIDTDIVEDLHSSKCAIDGLACKFVGADVGMLSVCSLIVPFVV